MVGEGGGAKVTENGVNEFCCRGGSELLDRQQTDGPTLNDKRGT